MNRRTAAINLKTAIKGILSQYRGLTITVHAIVSQLRDAGYTVTRETVRKHLKDAGCIAEQRGLYIVPAKPARREDISHEQRPEPAA